MAKEKATFERARDFFRMGKPIVAITIHGQRGFVTKMQTKKTDGLPTQIVTILEGCFETKNIEDFYIFDTIPEAQNFLNGVKTK